MGAWRGRRSAVWLVAGALGVPMLSVACAHEALPIAAGVSTASAQGAKRAAPPASARARWEHADAVGALSIVGARAPSLDHLAATHDAETRVNDVAFAAFSKRTAGNAMPIGTLVVATHVQPTTGALGPTFAMSKREADYDPAGGDWEYLVVDVDGMVDARGVLAACVRCHAEAPADHLFGPRPAGTKPSHEDASPQKGSAAPRGSERRAKEEAKP